MAEVFDTKAKRRQLARQARPAVRAAAGEIEGRARGNLAQHSSDTAGGAVIKVEHGFINSYVILEDVPGEAGWSPGALAIEFGRSGFIRKSDGRYVGPMEGLHILGRAI